MSAGAARLVRERGRDQGRADRAAPGRSSLSHTYTHTHTHTHTQTHSVSLFLCLCLSLSLFLSLSRSLSHTTESGDAGVPGGAVSGEGCDEAGGMRLRLRNHEIEHWPLIAKPKLKPWPLIAKPNKPNTGP